MKPAEDLMKLTVLIADDLEIGREQARAALLRVEGNYNHQAGRARAADALFDIYEFVIVGDAIEAIEKKGLRPDLAIVDIDFQGLKPKEVRDKGFYPEIEQQQMRGFDLLKTLETHSPQTMAVVFTGHAEQDDVYKELNDNDRRIGSDFFIKSSKAIGINELSKHLRDCIESLAVGLCKNVPYAERQRIRQSIVDNKGQIPEKENIKIGTRNILLNSLLAFACYYEHGQGVVMEEPLAAIRSLLPGDRVTGFQPRGWWDRDFVHQAIMDWRNAPDYVQLNTQIDAVAANYVFRTIICQKHGKPFDFDGIAEHQSNIGNAVRGYNAAPNFKYSFINALKVRRALIGLSRLSIEPVWVYRKQKNCAHEEILDLFLTQHSRLNDQGAARNYITTVRGLSAELYRPQRILTTQESVLAEETAWLEKYPPLILLKQQEYAETTFDQIPTEVFADD